MSTTPTRERIVKAADLYEPPLTDADHCRPYARVACPVERLHKTGKISDHHLQAWRTFVALHERGNRVSYGACGYDGIGDTGHFLTRADAGDDMACPQTRKASAYKAAAAAIESVRYGPAQGAIVALAVEPEITLEKVGRWYSSYDQKHAAVAAAVTLVQTALDAMSQHFGYSQRARLDPHWPPP